MPKALIGDDREVRFHRICRDLAIDLDATHVGVMELVQDEDYRLALISQTTWDATMNRLGDLLLLASLQTGPGVTQLPHWMLGEGWVPQLPQLPVPEVRTTADMYQTVRVSGFMDFVRRLQYDDVDDVLRHVQEADHDVAYCVGAPSCLQDVVSRERGFPLCEVHARHLLEIDSLLA